MKFEKSDFGRSHQLHSKNVLLDKENGRVVAVFYNEYDLDQVMKLQEDLKQANDELSYLEDIRCN